MYFQPKTKSVFQTHSEFRSAFPDTSFPVEITDDTMQSVGVFPVTKTTPTYDPMTHTVLEATPALVNDVWTQQWEVVALTPEEIQQRYNEQAKQVRSERNGKLAASDWTQVIDAPVDQSAWAAYRQALRDISTQADFPWGVQWPEKP